MASGIWKPYEQTRISDYRQTVPIFVTKDCSSHACISSPLRKVLLWQGLPSLDQNVVALWVIASMQMRVLASEIPLIDLLSQITVPSSDDFVFSNPLAWATNFSFCISIMISSPPIFVRGFQI
jgi:hypothetical protein